MSSNYLVYTRTNQFLLWSLALFSTISISFSLKCRFLFIPFPFTLCPQHLGGGLHKVICSLHERNYYPDLMYPFHMSVPVFMEAADEVDSVQLQLDTSSSAEEEVLSKKKKVFTHLFIHLFCCTFLTFFLNTSQLCKD